jgi:hypothetical protein
VFSKSIPVFGARLGEPQQCSQCKAHPFPSKHFLLVKLLRVTDPRSGRNLKYAVTKSTIARH